MKPEQSTVKHTAEVQMSANCADKIYRLLRNGLELRGLGKTARDIGLLVPSVQQIIEEEFKAFDQMLSALKAAKDDLKKSLSLSSYAVLSEESSSSHSHGPRKADEYGRKTSALEQEIRDGIARIAAAISAAEQKKAGS